MKQDPELRRLLEPLSPSRRAHSIEVGRKAEDAAVLVPQRLRADLVLAGYLHDVGYGYPTSGFHPLDGAALLASEGYSSVVCHLVAHHSVSAVEAQLLGIDLEEYVRYTIDDPDIKAADRVLTWADMTTGPTGGTVTVEERLAEVLERYGRDHVVTAAITEAAPLLRESCYFVEGSMKGSV